MATDRVSLSRLRRVEALSAERQREFWHLWHGERSVYAKDMSKVWKRLKELEWLELRERNGGDEERVALDSSSIT